MSVTSPLFSSAAYNPAPPYNTLSAAKFPQHKIALRAAPQTDTVHFGEEEGKKKEGAE